MSRLGAPVAAVVAAVLLMSAALAGCASDGDEPLFLTPTTTATEGATGAEATATATGGPGGATPSPSPPPEATTAAASPTPTPEPVLQGDDLPLPEGSPLGAADLVAAAEAAGWEVVGMPGEIDAVCPSTSVEGVAYGFLPADGGTGQVFVLWAYPTGDALQQDWAAGARVEPLTQGCDLRTGHVYWNRNLLLAFVPQEGDSAPDPGLREAFLELRP